MSSGVMLTDGGLETVLIFHDGLELPAFAAFPLVETAEGRDRLARYYSEFMAVAAGAGAGFVIETPTWRANPDWGAALGYAPDDLRRVNSVAVDFARDLAAGWTGDAPVLVSGCIGPRGDGYVPGAAMSAGQAADYHGGQVAAFAAAGVDLVTSMTLTYVEEAVGMVAAAAQAGVRAVAGFTVETDGRLASGQPLGEAIEQVDAETGSAAAWFMVNCAHPEHVALGLPPERPGWAARIGALRANASRMSHAELDAAGTLDDGDPEDLARASFAMRDLMPALRVVGGCCGTDVRHVAAISAAWAAAGDRLGEPSPEVLGTVEP